MLLAGVSLNVAPPNRVAATLGGAMPFHAGAPPGGISAALAVEGPIIRMSIEVGLIGGEPPGADGAAGAAVAGDPVSQCHALETPLPMPFASQPPN